jgi:N-acetylglutamate synthase-like GNAT family acetyltransferase
MAKIRELTGKDRKEVEHLFSTQGEVLLWDFNSFVEHPDCFGVVLEISEIIFGFGALIRYITPKHGLIGRLEDVLIHSDFQSGGLGKLIIDELITLGEKLQLRQIVLTSNPKREAARHIYVSRGFVLYETGVFVRNI